MRIAPVFVRGTVIAHRDVNPHSSFGRLDGDANRRSRRMRVEVRVERVCDSGAVNAIVGTQRALAEARHPARVAARSARIHLNRRSVRSAKTLLQSKCVC